MYLVKYPHMTPSVHDQPKFSMESNQDGSTPQTNIYKTIVKNVTFLRNDRIFKSKIVSNIEIFFRDSKSERNGKITFYLTVPNVTLVARSISRLIIRIPLLIKQCESESSF